MSDYEQLLAKFTKDGVTDYRAMLVELDTKFKMKEPIIYDHIIVAILGYLLNQSQTMLHSNKKTTLTIKETGEITISYN